MAAARGDGAEVEGGDEAALDAEEQAQPERKAGRKRFTGGPQALADALIPIARKKGKSFLRYPTEGKLPAAKVDVPSILAADDVLLACAQLQGNLSFCKTDTEKAMQIVGKKFQKTWALQDAHFNDWWTTLSGRLRNVLFVVGHAASKTKPPAWVANLTFVSGSARQVVEEVLASGQEEEGEVQQEAAPGKSSGDAAPGATSGDAAHGASSGDAAANKGSSDAGPGDFNHGWSTDLMMAWRVQFGRPASDKDFSNPIEVPEGVDDADFVLATWPDGYSAQVSECTYGMYKSQQRKHKSSAESSLWSGVHSITNNKVTVVQRVDRSLLLSVVEQGRQILQVRVDRFGELPGPQPSTVPRTDPTLSKAADFLQPIAEDYCRDVIKLTDLQQIRDEKLREEKIPMRVARRPAAAVTGEGEEGIKSRKKPKKVTKKDDGPEVEAAAEAEEAVEAAEGKNNIQKAGSSGSD